MFWPSFRKKRVGLVLGGGVARGIAHIGVLKVLQEYNIPLELVVGTSVGSLVGAAFATGMGISLMEEVALRIHWGDFFKLTLFRPAFLSVETIEDFVVKYLGDLSFSDLKVPFAAVATDLGSGKRVVINEGKVAKAVAASCAFPGVFAPVEVQGRLLVDGGIAGNVPVAVAREMGAEYVIASDVIATTVVRSLPLDPLPILARSLELILKKLSQEEARGADVLLEPEMEEDIWHLDLPKVKKLILAGEVVAYRLINRIKKGLRIRSWS